ncbi:GntR family transcriptional regulator [Mycobacterium florentinum]|uniref:GntR family transcriptional regulator n=1 Tax=Mycobacterium florentinum TaxID=292462 RepID=A0A1X1UE31_MYCFL|nr:PLP-dependent aminotransferase family protein [Mycobacterium florentinum]MCV7412095.1 PLP-dependent aminotransferase family protein [Mycobacterium florentinum]ORV54929.1 GntR family transcriptional regulator [Mycobacterium florentinum]BBX81470.1 putative transcriptional regulator, GntR family protein [Mycobacterium florentinum]
MPTSRYTAIVDQLTAQIRDGRLPPGTRLPTHRELARRHGIALATATRVYAHLGNAGLVAGEPGRGTFVRDQGGYGGLDGRRIAPASRAADLSFNQPLAADQAEQLREALRNMATTGDLQSVLTQHSPGGRTSDKAAVATYLLDRGIDVPPNNVVLTAGSQHGLDIALRVLARPGSVIAVEELTYPGIKLIAEDRSLELVSFPSGPAGPDLDTLAALCSSRRVAAVYTMPTLHNPLGYIMSREQRERLAEITRRHECAVIEDGTYAFLEPNSGPTLYALAPERTLHVASLSKSVATGLRFGFVVVPDENVARAKQAVRTSSWGTSSLVSALVTGWLTDGTVTRLEKQRRSDARERQQIAHRVLKGFDYQAHSSCYYGWLTLPERVRADYIAHELADQGILVSTAEAFCVTPHPPNALRLALGTPSLAELANALDRVREVILSAPW